MEELKWYQNHISPNSWFHPDLHFWATVVFLYFYLLVLVLLNQLQYGLSGTLKNMAVDINIVQQNVWTHREERSQAFTVDWWAELQSSPETISLSSWEQDWQ